jgi:hypothetical protein
MLTFIQNSLILIKWLSFDQSLRESTKKPRKNPINILRNQRKKEGENKEKKHEQIPYCEGSRIQQNKVK